MFGCVCCVGGGVCVDVDVTFVGCITGDGVVGGTVIVTGVVVGVYSCVVGVCVDCVVVVVAVVGAHRAYIRQRCQRNNHKQ